MNDAQEPHVVVVANGEHAHATRLLAVVCAADLVVAADGGANWLANQGLLPDVLVGDLDSVAPAVLQAAREGTCRLLQHARRKDETDTELAVLEAVRIGARRVTLLGALGGRVDHALANIGLLALPALNGANGAIYDGVSWLRLLRAAGPGQARLEIEGSPGDLLSLLPWGGDAEGISTQGLEYPLSEGKLLLGTARGVSNVLTASRAAISLRHGMLLVVHTPQSEGDASP